MGSCFCLLLEHFYKTLYGHVGSRGLASRSSVRYGHQTFGGGGRCGEGESQDGHWRIPQLSHQHPHLQSLYCQEDTTSSARSRGRQGKHLYRPVVVHVV